MIERPHENQWAFLDESGGEVAPGEGVFIESLFGWGAVCAFFGEEGGCQARETWVDDYPGGEGVGGDGLGVEVGDGVCLDGGFDEHILGCEEGEGVDGVDSVFLSCGHVGGWRGFASSVVLLSVDGR